MLKIDERTVEFASLGGALLGGGKEIIRYL